MFQIGEMIELCKSSAGSNSPAIKDGENCLVFENNTSNNVLLELK